MPSSTDYFQSQTCFSDMVQMFPNSASPELKAALAEGIPASYLIKLIDTPFSLNKIFNEIRDTLVLFYNIVEEDLWWSVGEERPTASHLARIERSKLEFHEGGFRGPKAIMAMLLLEDRCESDTIMNRTYYLKEALTVRLEEIKAATTNLTAFNHYYESSERKWVARKLMGYTVIAAVTEEGDTYWLENWEIAKMGLVRALNLVNFYYTGEEKEALLTAAYKQDAT